jgi:CBS domain-containing protein
MKYLVAEIMSRQPVTASPDTSLQQIALLMEEHDCGDVLIVEGGVLVGIITDRDLAVRGLAPGLPVSTPVREVMTGRVAAIRAHETADQALRLMALHNIRRLPVIDEDRHVLGVLSQVDLARVSAQDAGALMARTH